MKKLLNLLFLTATVMLFVGCARDVVVAEVLQIPEHASIYTRYNLWYENPNKMDTMNYQKGTILPFGTEVYIKEATTKKIVFAEVKTDKQYTIAYDMKYRMMTVEEYIRELFSTKDFDDLTLGISKMTIEKLTRGIVEPGMTKAEVELAFGPPCAYRTNSKELNTWCYWTDYLVGKRVVFMNNLVNSIIVLSSEKHEKELMEENGKKEEIKEEIKAENKPDTTEKDVKEVKEVKEVVETGASK